MSDIGGTDAGADDVAKIASPDDHFIDKRVRPIGRETDPQSLEADGHEAHAFDLGPIERYTRWRKEWDEFMRMYADSAAGRMPRHRDDDGRGIRL